jgi:hypothetical protein
MRHKLDTITGDTLHVTQRTDQLGRDISHTGELALQDVIVSSPTAQGQLDARLNDEAVPAVASDLAMLEQLDAADAFELRQVRGIRF